MSARGSKIFLFAAIMSALIHVSCGGPQPIAGGTSETTNGFVAIVHSSSGAIVPHALVRLRPEGYLADTSETSISFDSASIIDTFTDANGRFSITNIDTGKYSIEIQDGTRGGALLRNCALNDSIIDLGVTVVKPAGSIIGFINREFVAKNALVFVRVFGMERMVLADSISGTFVLPEMPQGNYSIYFMTTSSSNEPKTLTASALSGSATDIGKVSLYPFYDWAYSQSLGFTTTASGADIANDVYAFPILVRLNSGNFTFNQAKANGEDIRFVKSDSTPLPYQIERWDPVTEHAEIWVKIDTVVGNNDKQFITMLWGNSQATSLSKSDAVFDTANGFQGVWHLGDSMQDSLLDATANRYQGVSPDSARPSIAEGIIGNCREFDGVTDFITMPSTADSKLSFPQEGSYTVSAWVSLDTFDNMPHCIVAKGYEQYFLRFTYFPSNLPMWEFVEFNEIANWQSSRCSATAGQWVFLVGVRQGSSQLLYCNGVLVNSSWDSWPQGLSRNATNDLSIGKFLKTVTKPNNDGYCFFKGSIDEVRIIGAARSPEWVRLCYMNQRIEDKLIIIK
jgi:hypothetical protein